MHQGGLEPPRSPRRAAALQAAAEPFRPLMREIFFGVRRRRNREGKKLTKAVGAAARLTNSRRRAPANETRAHATNVAARTPAGACCLRPLKLLRLSNNEKSGPAGFPTGSRPAPIKSLRIF